MKLKFFFQSLWITLYYLDPKSVSLPSFWIRMFWIKICSWIQNYLGHEIFCHLKTFCPEMILDLGWAKINVELKICWNCNSLLQINLDSNLFGTHTLWNQNLFCTPCVYVFIPSPVRVGSLLINLHHLYLKASIFLKEFIRNHNILALTHSWMKNVGHETINHKKKELKKEGAGGGLRLKIMTR